MDTYGTLFSGQDAETVHRLPDMTQRPTDLRPTSSQPEASPSSLPEPQHVSQHPECRSVLAVAIESDSLQNPPQEGNAENTLENGEICDAAREGAS